jgi:hypothetical protein
MGKLSDAARALAVLAAIVGAFVTLPSAAAILLVLGGISALDNSGDNVKIYTSAIVLTVGAASLSAIPVVGSYLVAIFSGLGTALVGASVVGITLSAYHRLRADWAPKAAA